jgi:hypothetical protein
VVGRSWAGSNSDEAGSLLDVFVGHIVEGLLGAGHDRYASDEDPYHRCKGSCESYRFRQKPNDPDDKGYPTKYTIES